MSLPEKKIGVVRFPGTNCDRDAWQSVLTAGFKPEWLWHEDRCDLAGFVGVVIPGGFSYGDYLRSGALAARSPVMSEVSAAAKKGLPVLGICNGFQILCECGMLPGALVKNESTRFVDQWVELEKVADNPHFATGVETKKIRLPVAHADGRFYVDDKQLVQLYEQERVWWRYQSNVNGSVDQIAGVMNEQKNVAGLMPHPDRAMHCWMGGVDGLSFFTGMGD